MQVARKHRLLLGDKILDYMKIRRVCFVGRIMSQVCYFTSISTTQFDLLVTFVLQGEHLLKQSSDPSATQYRVTSGSPMVPDSRKMHASVVLFNKNTLLQYVIAHLIPF